MKGGKKRLLSIDRTKATAGAATLADSIARSSGSTDERDSAPGWRSRRKMAAVKARFRLWRSRSEARWATRASAASGRTGRGREASSLKAFQASSVRWDWTAHRREDSRAEASSGVRDLRMGGEESAAGGRGVGVWCG